MKTIVNINNNVRFIIGAAFTNKIFYLIIIVMTILGLILSGVFFPFTFSSNFDYFIIVTIPMFLVLGWFSYSVRKSNIYSGMEVSGHTKNEFYLGQLISIWVIGTTLTIWYLFAFEIFAQCGLLLSTYWVDPNFDLMQKIDTLLFKNTYWIVNMIYIYNINVLITFSIYFMVHNLVKDQKQYYIFVMILMLLTFIYGGFLNEYFDSARKFEDGKWYPDYSKNLFPDSMFPISLLFPYFSVHSMFSYGFTLTAIEHRSAHATISNITGYGNWFWNLSWEYNKQWVMIFIAPYVWVLIGFFVGKATSKLKSNI